MLQNIRDGHRALIYTATLSISPKKVDQISFTVKQLVINHPLINLRQGLIM